MDGVVAYILGKSYTKKSLIGIGALAGAPCQVQSINKVDKTTTITLKWEDNVGGVHTQSFDIEDGEDGVSVTNATIKPNGHLELTLSDGTPIDCGQVLPQYDTMPIPSASNVGQILQYIGTSTSSYTNGYFYECVNDGGVYKWVAKSVQDSYTKFEIGDLTNLPDNTKNVVENIGVLKLSIDQLQASKLSISDIDSELSDSSTNPVQNKVIKLTIDQLRGSILDILANKEDRFRYSTMPTADLSQLNKIYQFIGETGTYTNGGFYKCIYDNVTTTYSWVRVLVDDVYTKSEIGSLTDLPDNTKNIVENITTIKLNIDQLQASKVDKITGKGLSTNDFTDVLKDKVIALAPIYLIGSGLNLDTNTGKLTATGISIPIDNALSNTSTNPVQNKVITLAMEDKLDKVASSINEDFAGFDSSGNLIDLGINKNIVPSSASSSNKLLTESDNLTLGETSTTAYAGDKGKTNADHIGNLANLSTTVKTDLVNAINEVKGGIPSVPTAYTSNPEMDGTANAGSSTSWAKGDHVHPTDTSRASATDLSNHISNTSNPHSVTASQVGLGNVVNTGDSATPVSGGTTKFTTGGAYTELNKKADIVSGATENNLAALDSNGNLIDSGNSSSDFSTVKERKTPASGGQTLSLVNTGDMYNWNNKPTTLGGLTDVTLSSLADGQILEYDGNNSTWKNAGNIKDFARFGGSKTFSQLTSSLLTAENVDKFYLCTDGGTISSADASNWILPAGAVIPPDSHIAVIEYTTGVYKFDDFGGYIDISGKADKSELDGWTSTATVSNNTVTFSGLDNSYGYDLYCQDKLLGISSITKTTSGSTITLQYTVTGASGGETCKLRIIK